MGFSLLANIPGDKKVEPRNHFQFEFNVYDKMDWEIRGRLCVCCSL